MADIENLPPEFDFGREFDGLENNSRYVIHLGPGDRGAYYDANVLAASLTGADLIVFSGITLAILSDKARQTLFEALAAARKSGAQIAFDPNYRPRLWASEQEARSAIETGYRHATIALPTFDDEAALFADATPEATAERIAALGPETIAVKCGADAALVRHPGAVEHIPPDSIIDHIDGDEVFPAPRHAVVAVGYGEAPQGRVVLVRNSWGLSWGLEGYGWVTEQFLARHMYGLALLTDETDV